jgi:PAS domain-containing protein
MSQGLAMFDTDERLVIANHRFAEMYGLAPDQVLPGTTLRTILEHRIAGGLHSGETGDSLLQVMRQHLSRHKAGHLAERLSDGRAILVSIRPRPEGGWVTTHQDVTERENLNAELALQNELLRQREDQLQTQNEQFNAALRNMSQGLCMFDAKQRVVVANARYAQLYGLAAEQVRPCARSWRLVLPKASMPATAKTTPRNTWRP